MTRKYKIGCQDCDELGLIRTTHWFWGKRETTCPTCKGEKKVSYGTKFNRGYEIVRWLKPWNPQGVNAIHSVVWDRMQHATPSSSRYESRTDDGPGLLTGLAVVTLLSSSSSSNDTPMTTADQ